MMKRDRECEGWEQDKRFNLSREVPTISAVEGEKLIQELTDFEQKISELGVISARQLFRIRTIAAWARASLDGARAEHEPRGERRVSCSE